MAGVYQAGGPASLIEKIGGILRRMSHAAMRAGRDPGAVTLVSVTKGIGIEAIGEAIDAGLRVFGENRVQEVLRKSKELDAGIIKWHMIGHLQKNKARAAVGIFELIHSLDSVELAAALDRHSAALGKTQRALVEVKLSAEASKTGLDKENLGALIKEAEGMKNLNIEGLMAMPPYSANPEDSRRYYRELRELAHAYGLRELSMGMSGDFEVAIEEGATLVRIGSAIFANYPEGGA